MPYWLLKSEPYKYSFAQLRADKTTFWDGVRNHQAAANLKAMEKGDEAFFYHSNEGLCIVGTCRIIKPAEPDPTDASGKFVGVTIAYGAAFPTPVTLAVMKADAGLQDMALLRQSRLSVAPVRAAEWKRICAMGKL